MFYHWMLWLGIGAFMIIRHIWGLSTVKAINVHIEVWLIIIDSLLWVTSGIMLYLLIEKFTQLENAIRWFNAANKPLEWQEGNMFTSQAVLDCDKKMQELREVLDNWTPE